MLCFSISRFCFAQKCEWILMKLCGEVCHAPERKQLGLCDYARTFVDSGSLSIMWFFTALTFSLETRAW